MAMFERNHFLLDCLAGDHALCYSGGMAGIRRFEPRKYGVQCDACGFPAEVTIWPGGQRTEYPDDRSDHCTHRNAEDGYFIDECPNWLRSMKSGRPLDEDGNLL